MPFNWSLTTNANMNDGGAGGIVNTATSRPPKQGAVESPAVTLYLTKQHSTSESIEYQYVIEYRPSSSGPVVSGTSNPDVAANRFFDLRFIDSIRNSFRVDSDSGFKGSGNNKEETVWDGGFDLVGIDENTTVRSGTIEIKKSEKQRTVSFALYVEWESLNINGAGAKDYPTTKLTKTITIDKKTATTPDEDPGTGGTPSGDGGSGSTSSTDEVPLWTADWSTAKVFELDGNTATEPPPAPSATIEQSEDGKNPTLVVKVDTSNITDTKYRLGLMFDVVQDDVSHLYGSDDVIIYPNEDDIITNIVTARFEVYNGSRYNVRCKTIKTVGKELRESEWSDWSETVEAAPLAPKQITVCRAGTSDGGHIDSIYLEWTSVPTAKAYEIQYATRRDMDSLEDSDNFKSVKTGDKGTKFTFKVSDSGTSGNEYFVRVRALGESDSIKSAWSPIESVVLGTEPEAPTTWSSTSSVIVGETINLYWIHNSTDGSSETRALLDINLVHDDATESMYKDPVVIRPNPTLWLPGMKAYKDEYYTYGNALYKCVKSGEPTSITNAEFFEKVKDEYDPNETSYYTLKTSSIPTDKRVVAIKWSVVTWGIDSSKPSPSSDAKRIDVYSRPRVTLAVTDHQGNDLTTLTSLPIQVSASATDNFGTQSPIGYYLSVKANESYTTRDAIGNPKVVHKDDLVYYKYFDINKPLDVILSAGDITLENNISYTISCIASMDSGLTAENSRPFTVAWSVEQHLPTASVVINTNTYAAAIRPYCEETVPLWYTVNKRADGTYSVGSRVSGEVNDLIPLVKSAEPIGKNLLDIATVIEAKNCTTESLNGVLTITKTDPGVTYASMMPIYLIGGKKYTLNYSASNTPRKFTIFAVDVDGELGDPITQGTKVPATFTPPESGYYRVDFHNDGEVADILTIRNAQVEVGTTATAYEEYQGTDVVIEKTTTGVEIYVSESGDKYYCNLFEKRLVEDVVLSIYRRDHDGGFTEIAKNIPNANTYVPDPHPALDYARYRIVATSTRTGYVSYYDLPNQPVKCNSVIIQWDEEWNDYDADAGRTTEKTWTGSLLSIPYNIDVSDKRAVDVEMINYVGRKHPVSYYGTHLGETASWSCAVPKSDKETLYALRRLAAWAGDVYVREPSGVGYWANVVVNFSQKHCDPVVPVSFEITRVEGGV